MGLTLYSLAIIIGCALVTWLPRVIPFMLVRKVQLPDMVVRFLSYVPIAILTALFVQSVLIHRNGGLPQINIEYLCAAVPTIITAIVTKNLMWIVVVGMASMAIIRYFISLNCG